MLQKSKFLYNAIKERNCTFLQPLLQREIEFFI